MGWYAVAGHPVLHSRSPDLFNHWFEHSGRADSCAYTRISGVSLADILQSADELGICGLNVTSPFKEEAYRLATDRGPETESIGAANTLTRTPAGWNARNTDVTGIISTLHTAGVCLKGAHCLVVGAGGAARAAVYALSRSGADVSVVNRSPDRIVQLSDVAPITARSTRWMRQVPAEGLTAIIWTIPAYPEEMRLAQLGEQTVVLDANYATSPPPGYFGGAVRMDGLAWLVEQARETHRIWFGVKPPEVPELESQQPDNQCHAQSQWMRRTLVLSGFMGAGKTTIARHLARLLNRESVDVDHRISIQTGCTIRSLFEQAGESGFRSLESDTFLRLLASGIPILAAGGGLPTQPHLREILRSRTLTVLLHRPLANLDTESLASDRPLFSSHSVLQLFQERREHYLSTAHLVICQASRSPATIARLLARELANWEGP